MKKIKNIWKYLNPKNLQKDIHMYGYEYKLSQHILVMSGVILGLIIAGGALGIGYVGIVLLCVGFILTLPISVMNIYVNLFEQKKFVDVSNYIEQLLYSFKRQSKILSALEDTLLLYPDGMMHNKIVQMIKYLQNTQDSENIYENAFAIMEQEYDCEMVRKTHAFVTNVEIYGGEYEQSADILILDRNKWVTRVVEAQEQKKSVKRNMMISVVLSMGIVCMMSFIIPSQFNYLQSTGIAQFITGIAIIANYAIWLYVTCRLSGSWIVIGESISEKQIDNLYRISLNNTSKSKTVSYVKTLIITSTVLATWFITGKIQMVFMVAVIGYLLLTDEKRKKKRAYKILRREVEKAFPEWMLAISLLLQTDNVQVAIDKSMKDAPYVLKYELHMFMEKIQVNPTGIEPYLQFCEYLKIEDIQSAMKMLYAMSQYGAEDISKQIYAFVERNAGMQDRSERMKMEDYLSGMGFFVLAPMLIGSLKLMGDMGMLILGLLHETQGLM